jgi:hypothetical protein
MLWYSNSNDVTALFYVNMEIMMDDIQLKHLLNLGGIGSTLYEGEIGEKNMETWHKLADVFKEYYDMQAYNERCKCDNCACGKQ